MKSLLWVIGALVVGGGYFYFFYGQEARIAENSRPLTKSDTLVKKEHTIDLSLINISSRQINIADRVTLPLSGSAPDVDVEYSVPLEEIRRGCFRQDCIPSVDEPLFVSVAEAKEILPEDTIGIALEYKGVTRFYPFNMLATREIVNDVVAGDPLLVTYCPLCGTGIVYDRTIGGVVFEFGVSGMLWQSNLLMYNRADLITDRNLWSQVLGEAVVGHSTGAKLSIVPSNIVKWTDWHRAHPEAEVLDTGYINDPYNGNYYEVAQRFGPNFEAFSSPLDPSAYVYGIEIEGVFKAYPQDALKIGTITDTVGAQTLAITKTATGLVTIENEVGEIIPDVEGFWFSWVAAHPETLLWSAN